jgi:hypothetical protein
MIHRIANHTCDVCRQNPTHGREELPNIGRSGLAANLPKQPRLGIGPVALHRPLRETQCISYLSVGETDEKSQLDDIRLHFVFRRELIQRLMHLKQSLVALGSNGRDLVEIHPFLTAAVAQTLPATRFFDQDSAHSLRRGGEEVRAVLPKLVFGAHESQPCFVNERGGLQGLAGFFLRNLGGSEPAQLIINQRQQLIGGGRIAVLSRFQNARDIAHAFKSSCKPKQETARNDGRVPHGINVCHKPLISTPVPLAEGQLGFASFVHVGLWPSQYLRPA